MGKGKGMKLFYCEKYETLLLQKEGILYGEKKT